MLLLNDKNLKVCICKTLSTSRFLGEKNVLLYKLIGTHSLDLYFHEFNFLMWNTFKDQEIHCISSSCGEESACSAGDTGDAGSIPGSGRSPRGGNGNPLQYSCLKSSTDKGAWWAAPRSHTYTQTAFRMRTLGSMFSPYACGQSVRPKRAWG